MSDRLKEAEGLLGLAEALGADADWRAFRRMVEAYFTCNQSEPEPTPPILDPLGGILALAAMHRAVTRYHDDSPGGMVRGHDGCAECGDGWPCNTQALLERVKF